MADVADGGFGPCWDRLIILISMHRTEFPMPWIDIAMKPTGFMALDRQLANHEYVAGDYSIADMAIFPWTRTFKRQNVNIEDYKHVMRWRQLMSERPAVKKAFSVGKELREDLKNLDDAEWKNCSDQNIRLASACSSSIPVDQTISFWSGCYR